MSMSVKFERHFPSQSHPRFRQSALLFKGNEIQQCLPNIRRRNTDAPKFVQLLSGQIP